MTKIQKLGKRLKTKKYHKEQLVEKITELKRRGFSSIEIQKQLKIKNSLEYYEAIIHLLTQKQLIAKKLLQFEFDESKTLYLMGIDRTVRFGQEVIEEILYKLDFMISDENVRILEQHLEILNVMQELTYGLRSSHDRWV